MNNLALKAKKAFLDSLKIRVTGGSGGTGLQRYGGIGGKGGDVYIRGNKNVTSLSHVIRRKVDRSFYATNGRSSRKSMLLGEPGYDLILDAPLGVTVEEVTTRRILGNIDKHQDKILVALGGRGGDRYNDNQGHTGQSELIRLVLKMISDAAFVGFPNAGKSSLLRAVSNAKPKVANYPFTTLRPHLGHVEYDDYRQITMADLPGLVEGAHKNIGLGHEFLKHIERARMLVFVVDINRVNLGPDYAMRSSLETLCILNKEIELYNDTLLSKPAILVLSKMDTVHNPEVRVNEFKKSLQEFQENPSVSTVIEEPIRPQRLIKFDEIVPLSSSTGYNLDKLKLVVREVIDKYAEMDKLERDKFSSYEEMQQSEYNRLEL